VAVLFDEYAPFDSGAGANVTESTWRKMMVHAGRANGVLRGLDNALAVTGDSSGMQVKVATGQVWIEGHWGRSETIKTVPVSASHATLARLDRVIVRVDFVNNKIELDTLTGTPAASPALPSLTQNSSVYESHLAEVAVAAAASTISAGNVTDNRIFTSSFARFTKSGTQSLTTGTTTKVSCSVATTAGGEIIANSGNTEWTLNRDGWWLMSAGISFATGTTGFRRLAIGTAGGTMVAQQETSASPDSVKMNVATALQVVVGTAYSLYGHHTQGSSLNVDADDDATWIAFTWMGY
jgi:hypothetical protein